MSAIEKEDFTYQYSTQVSVHCDCDSALDISTVCESVLMQIRSAQPWIFLAESTVFQTQVCNSEENGSTDYSNHIA